MRLTVLIENTAPPGLKEEWGLSLHIRYKGKEYLLDTGGSGLFAENARTLGIDLSAVDAAVLSHAHNDHSDGMDVFFRENDRAFFYIRQGAGENCYTLYDDEYVYEGIHRGWLETYAHRIRWAEGHQVLDPGVSLLPHSTPGLEAVGEKARMYILEGETYKPDDLSHEQSLIFDTAKGLVILNACSHAGADVIVREAMAAFPGRPVEAMIGGFHLFETPPKEVEALALRLGDTVVARVLTGHCTGQAAYDIIEGVLGDRVAYLATGSVFDL